MKKTLLNITKRVNVKVAEGKILHKPDFCKGWFSLVHKHKHKPIYADAVRCL